MANYTKGAQARAEAKREQAKAEAEKAKAEASKAEAEKAKAELDSKPTIELPSVELPEEVSPEATGNLLNQAQDFIAEGLGLRSVEESRQQRQQGMDELDEITESIRTDDSVPTELAKSVLGAPANLAYKVAGAAEFTGDFAGSLADALNIIDREEEDIVWSDQYKYAQYDLGAAETQTWYGGILQEAFSFILGGAATTPAISAVGLTGKGAVAANISSDFVLDYFAAGAEGPNISAWIQDTALANGLSKALDSTEYDNVHARRFFNALEGTAPSIAVEAVKKLYRGIRAGKAFNGTPEQKAAEAQRVAQEDPVGPAADAARAENNEVSGRPAPEPTGPSDERVAELRSRAEQLQAQINELDEFAPGYGVLRDELDEVLEELPLNDYIKIEGFYSQDVDVGRNGSASVSAMPAPDFDMADVSPEVIAKIREVFVDQTADMSDEQVADLILTDPAFRRQSNIAANDLGKEISVIDLAWDAEGEIGTQGLLNVWRGMNSILQELEPGTVVRNYPASDQYGVGASQAQRRISEANAQAIDEGQFERFQRRMDENIYPLTIGDRRYETIRDHFIGLTPRQRESIAGPSTQAMSNARSRMYERAGFGPIQPNSKQYGIVRGSKVGRRWIEPVNDLSELPAVQQRVINEAQAEKPALYEPQERALQVEKETDVNAAAASFWEDELPGGGRSLVDEVDIDQIKTQEGLRDFIAERIPNVDVNDIARRLSRNPPEYVEDVFRSLARFADTGNFADLDELRFTNTQGVQGVDAGGAVVFDTLVKSVSERVNVLSEAIVKLDDVGGSVKTQAEQLLKRVETLTNMKKEATQFSSTNLKNWGDIPPDLKRAVARDRERSAALFNELRQNLFSTNPAQLRKGKKQLRQLAIGLNLSKGDPRLQMQLIEGLARVGWDRFSSVMIQSLLSGPLTHVRNVSGNLLALGERTLVSRPIGRVLQGDFKGAARSFHALGAIHEAFAESLVVAGQSMKSPYAVTTPASKVRDFRADTRRQMDSLVKNAKSGPERSVALVAKTIFDFSLNPWFQWPGKALQMGDDFTKSMLARMELKVQAADEAAKVTQNMNPREASAKRAEIYQKLKEQKLSANGQILDHDLVKVTENASFQRPLEGWLGGMASGLQQIPGGRTFFMPFLTTGVNITRYGLQGTPAGLFQKEVRDALLNGTPDEQAIMAGRMAAGTILGSVVVAAAQEDRVTGYGPAPGPERELWLQKHKPHSIHVYDDENGDPVWIEHTTVPGMSMVWSVLADTVNLVQDLSEGEQENIITSSAFFIASAIDSQPMFQGVMNLAQFLDVQKWPKDYVTEGMLDLTNRALGGAQLRRTFENKIATSMHEYKDWRNKRLAEFSGGLTTQLGITEPIAVTDVITGKPVLTKYQSNEINLINPFTVQVTNPDKVIDFAANLGYSKIADAVPTRVGGVPLEPAEEAFMRKEIYANGDFRKAWTNIIEDKDHIFYKEFNEWQQAYAKGQYDDGTPVPPKEETTWWDRLDTIVSRYVLQAKRKLMNGDDPVALNYQRTREERLKKLPSGGAKDFTPEVQARFQQVEPIREFANP